MRNRATNKRIGELLLEKNLITEEQLAAALKEQKLKGGYLSQHLISLGFIKDEDITMCLANQLGFPYLPLKNYQVSKEAIDAIPAKFIPVYCLLPIDKMEGLVTIAMADPLNEGVVNILRKITNCQVNIFISTYREIKEAIEKQFNTTVKEFDLDKFKDDKILSVDNKKMILAPSFSGEERRRYKRLNKELEVEYFLYPQDVKSKVRNISMSGLLFEADSPLPSGMQLGMIVHIGEKDILAAIEIVRSELKDVVKIDSQKEKPPVYLVAGTFHFLSKEDQNLLADYLRSNLV